MRRLAGRLARAGAAGAAAAVPTLVLDGSADLRTPSRTPRGVAARIPGAPVVAVPFTGHSVLGSDLCGCAQDARRRVLRGPAAAPCTGAAARHPRRRRVRRRARPRCPGARRVTQDDRRASRRRVRRRPAPVHRRRDRRRARDAGRLEVGGLRGGYATATSARLQPAPRRVTSPACASPAPSRARRARSTLTISGRAAPRTAR